MGESIAAQGDKNNSPSIKFLQNKCCSLVKTFSRFCGEKSLILLERCSDMDLMGNCALSI